MAPHGPPGPTGTYVALTAFNGMSIHQKPQSELPQLLTLEELFKVLHLSCDERTLGEI